MRAYQDDGNEITNVAIFDGPLPDGWTEAKGAESKGWSRNGNGKFKAPPVVVEERTNQEKIADLESKVTKRYIRAALLGDQTAINKIQDIENKIEALR